MKSDRFDFIDFSISGLFLIEPHPIKDDRGFLKRFFCANEFAKIGLNKPIMQINHTLTAKKGSVRGLHFQFPPFTETKIVTCIKGEVLDFAVDIRNDSPSFLQWHCEKLSAENQNSFYIPDGFAHGFQTLTDDCELIYLHTEMYQSGSEGALNICDPIIGINLPLPISDISERDKNHSFIDSSFKGIRNL